MLRFLDRLLRRAPPSEATEAQIAAEEAHEDVVRRSPQDTEGDGGDEPWIGVDLDGTLALYDGWRGLKSIGKPIPRMVRRVEGWVERGLRVKVFTARASVPGGAEAVRAWLEKHGLPGLEVTHEKDFGMIELWDDRAVQILPNTGKAVLRPTFTTLPKAPMLDDETEGESFQREARIAPGRPKPEREDSSSCGDV